MNCGVEKLKISAIPGAGTRSVPTLLVAGVLVEVNTTSQAPILARVLHLYPDTHRLEIIEASA